MTSRRKEGKIKISDLAGISTAEQLLIEQKISKPPVDVERICANWGIRIHYADLKDVESTHGNKGISGALITTPAQKGFFTADMLVNVFDIYTRQRYTIAHELAHFFLHHDNADSEKVMISFRGSSSKIELEANRFAADLLMPKELVYKHHSDSVLPLIWTLAEEFNVSQAAMRIRLDYLGLRYYTA